MTRDENQERIEAAAIWHKGRVYKVSKPYRHHDVIKTMAKMGFGVGAMKHQGFSTSLGRFVDRKEAARIAIAAGQIEKLPHGTSLFSEFIFPIDYKIPLPFELPG